ncbi:MAG: polyhydroxyalkanoate synthesis regulator DNA-binding domain-containing protein [Vicinamibacterales bacterium]
MIRVIKRYGSRKLYDTEESRYVSLDELADWVRAGQQLQVVDNQTAEDVTAHTLTQVILDEGRRRGATFSPAFLHDLIRSGERVVSSGVESLQSGVDRLIQASVDRVPPLRSLRDETRELRKRLELLEVQLSEVESVLSSKLAPAVGHPVRAATAAPDRGAKPMRVATRRKGA